MSIVGASANERDSGIVHQILLIPSPRYPNNRSHRIETLLLLFDSAPKRRLRIDSSLKRTAECLSSADEKRTANRLLSHRESQLKLYANESMNDPGKISNGTRGKEE